LSAERVVIRLDCKHEHAAQALGIALRFKLDYPDRVGMPFGAAHRTPDGAWFHVYRSRSGAIVVKETT